MGQGRMGWLGRGGGQAQVCLSLCAHNGRGWRASHAALWNPRGRGVHRGSRADTVHDHLTDAMARSVQREHFTHKHQQHDRGSELQGAQRAMPNEPCDSMTVLLYPRRSATPPIRVNLGSHARVPMCAQRRHQDIGLSARDHRTTGHSMVARNALIQSSD